MAKYLITGFSGFVGRHFTEYLFKNKKNSEIVGIDINPPSFGKDSFPGLKWEYKKIDLMNKEGLGDLLFNFRPDYILHLAAHSSVAFSWKEPALSFQNNTNIFLNILEVVRGINPRSRILAVGSSDVYGNVSPAALPLTENSPLAPVSPYAMTRVFQEMMAALYVKEFGVKIISTRSFNHIGPGQRDNFVVSSFAKKIVELKIGGNHHITTGDTSIIRDFVDVRDVVKAYDLLFQKGRIGEVYNICSGKGYLLEEIIQMMAEIVKKEVVSMVDPKLIRPSDNQAIIGSNKKIIKEIGWRPEITLKQSLKDLIEYWQEKGKNGEV
ncbi:MAG: GDP-mannose 4,6-dehydratase [Candidatus Omnitrophota bacterium]